MKFGSIRSKVILLFIPLIVLPLLIGGVVGAFYFQDVLKQHIWNEDMTKAKDVSAFTASYIDLSKNHLASIADRPSVVQAVEERNLSFLNETVFYTGYQSIAFDSAFITDDSGNVMAYNTIYPNQANRSYPGIIGKSLLDRPYVGPVLNTSRPTFEASRNDIDGSSTIYVSVPIRDNNSTIGTIVGMYDMGNYTSTVIGPVEEQGRIVYLVNGSGNIIVHSNRSYMSNMADFSSVPVVREVIHGKEGVTEQYNPIEKENRLAAYYPINGSGWGIVVAVPTSVAYQPVTSVLWVVSAVTLALIAIALALAYAFSKSITDSILGLYAAARAISDRGEYKKYLPLERKDEIGQVADYMDKMAQHIEEDRGKIESERDRAEAERNRAEDEKQRSELYLDLMGHDINNMNQIAMGYLEIAMESLHLTKGEREMLEKPQQSLKNSSVLIDNVHKLQKIEEGSLKNWKIDLCEIISEVKKDYSHIPDRSVTINFKPVPQCYVLANELVKDVFSNLVGNAIKHSDPHKPLTINLNLELIKENERDYYKVIVEDNGPGIPDDVKTRLFMRFQRGDTQAHGKGLGLYLVRTLVEDFHGNVWVEDRVKGDYTKGARFVVMLPAIEK